MGKRVDHDSTMEMSTSQLVPDVPRHDQSVWKQTVVGTDQFAPTQRGSGVRRIVLLLCFLALAAAAAAGAYYFG
ncbi:MAG: hypothetical protein H0T46_35375 [Deltaproteobacteria bacterium]|nr:hypothetical protein [Deltaproteobacteria bacterium]